MCSNAFVFFDDRLMQAWVDLQRFWHDASADEVPHVLFVLVGFIFKPCRVVAKAPFTEFGLRRRQEWPDHIFVGIRNDLRISVERGKDPSFNGIVEVMASDDRAGDGVEEAISLNSPVLFHGFTWIFFSRYFRDDERYRPLLGKFLNEGKGTLRVLCAVVEESQRNLFATSQQKISDGDRVDATAECHCT